MKIKKLNEDTLENAVKRDAEQAARDIDHEVAVDGSKKGQIEKALDKLLKVNRRLVKANSGEFVNLLLIGRAGVGKTAVVTQWAEANGINLIQKDAKSLDPTDLGGIIAKDDLHPGKAVRLSNSEFDKLDVANSVLFLDEFNRAPQDVRGSLLTLVNNHLINDADEDTGVRKLKGFLFTVAAINPPTAGYNTDALDVAERSRFMQKYIEAEPDVLLQHLQKRFGKEEQLADDEEEAKEARGRIRLATALLTNKEFAFDTEEDEERATDADPNAPILNPRSFTLCLEACDGTKEDLLAIWNSMCNRDKKPMVQRILADYKDKDDKANDALKRYKGGKEVKSAFGKSGPDYFDQLGL